MSTGNFISDAAIERRRYWISEIVKIGGHFGQDTERVEQELEYEVKHQGLGSIIDHLRLCSAIPESYGHNTSEEKLYSKYTDTLLALSFRQLGFQSLVLTERGDAADVECYSEDCNFVADAKVFRLSRTAKNAKDFKVQAMDNWKHGKRYAIIVAPLYQLPARTSQIYHQAASRNVCILSFSHVAVLVNCAANTSDEAARALLLEVLRTVEALNPSKDSIAYWSAVNRTLLSCGENISELWREEKLASSEAIELAKTEALEFLAEERKVIAQLSHEEALRRLMEVQNLDARQRVIESTQSNGLMDIVY